VVQIRAWLLLLRPPNFLTVPGDVLAGFALATGAGAAAFSPGMGMVMLASLFFYGGGLLLNDWADAAVDREERPDRPVPAGLVKRMHVLLLATGFLVAGVLLCLLQGGLLPLVGLALAGAVASYNLFLKRWVLAGALTMGLCRALNVGLGAVLAAGGDLPPLVWWGGLTILAYIAAVTHLARSEMSGRYWLVERWLPAWVLGVAFFTYLPLSQLIQKPGQVAVAVLFVVVTAGAGRVAVRLPGRKGLPAAGAPAPVPVPPLIGRLIGLLIPLQSAFIIGSGDEGWRLAVAFVILLMWPLKRWAARFFYSS
jgi:hypothetical protein